jgi:hypothetical protein
MSQVTLTEEEVAVAKQAIDFLINKCTLPTMTAVEAFAFSKQLTVLSKVPKILEQYVFEVRSITQGDEEVDADNT